MKSIQGFAIAVVLLIAAVALGAAVSAAFVSSVAARQATTSERRSTTALFAAESGLNTVVPRSKSSTYAFLSSDDTVAGWLERVDLATYELPNGAVVNLSVVDETSEVVTIRSQGVAAGGSSRVVLQDFEIADDDVDLGLFANAALVTQGSLNSNSAVSKIIGRDAELDSWLFTDRVLADALHGEFFQVTEACGTVTYRMDDEDYSSGDATIDVEKVAPDSCAGQDELAADTPGTLIPFAVADDEDGNGLPVGDAFNQLIQVTDTTIYAPGNTILIDDGEAVINSVDADAGTIDITWQTLPSNDVTVATPIRREVPSALAETSCPSGPAWKVEEKLPQGCYLEDLSNLWEKTFPGITKGEMLDLAKSYDRYYGPEADEEWPTTVLSDVTWIDGAQTGNFNGRGKGKGGGNDSDTSGRGICGEGVVIVNTGVYDSDSTSDSINMNVSDCEFKGIIYVIGELGIQGNLDGFSGTILVETDQGTRVQGNGTKALYDPIAIRKALANLPPPPSPVGLVGGIPRTWRFGE